MKYLKLFENNKSFVDISSREFNSNFSTNRKPSNIILSIINRILSDYKIERTVTNQYICTTDFVTI